MKAAAARRFGWWWKPQLYAVLVLGFLLGRALPGSQTALVGIALVAAVAVSGAAPSVRSAAALAVMAGVISVHSLSAIVWVVMGVSVCLLLSVAFLRKRSGSAPLAAAAVAAVATAVPGALGPGRPDTVLLAFWVGLAAVAALVFTLALSNAFSGRLPHPASGDAPVPMIILLAAALTGLEGLAAPSWLSLRDLAAAMVTLVCAYMGGAPLGAAAGGLLGITFLFSALDGNPGQLASLDAAGQLVMQNLSMGYVVAGMLAGTFRDLRKVGVGTAFSLGLLIYAALFVYQLDDLFRLAYTTAVAVGLFWATPRAWLGRVPGALAPPPAAGLDVPSAPAGPAPLPAVMDRLTGMSRVFKEVSRTFEQVAAVDAAPRDQGLAQGQVFEQVSERVCRSCSMYRHCWEKEFDKTYQLYSDLWLHLDEEGPLSTQSVPGELKQHCIFPDRVAFTLNYLHDLSHSHAHWERKLEEGRTVVADYLKNVARMLDRFVEEVGTGGGQPRPEPQPALRATSGVARVPKRGSYISGDSYMGEALGADRYVLALSDGMGVGRSAATESKQCVTLLREILKAGFATDVAVKTVNSALLLHSPEESFATVDLALIDLTSGRTEFVKVGAAPSFIKRGSDVTQVKVSSVPVGIINQVQVEPEFRVLRPGDLVVMITDGVWDVCKNDLDKERWILDHLRRESAGDPEAVAESLLARALDLMPETHDDLTVLVARVEAVSGASAQADKLFTGSWAPVRRAPRNEGGAQEKSRK